MPQKPPKGPPPLDPDAPLPLDTPPSPRVELLDTEESAAPNLGELPPTGSDGGLPPLEPPQDDGGSGGSNRKGGRALLDGHIEGIRIPLPIELVLNFKAWLLGLPDEKRQQVEVLALGDQWAEWITDMAQRDAAEDDHRPPGQRHYAFADVLGARFGPWMAQYFDAQLEAARRETARVLRETLWAKLRLAFPELDADRLRQVLAPQEE